MRNAASDRTHQGAIALQLQNVTVRYGQVTALQGITLTVARGDQIAVVGPNGAGKSTLFSVITGLANPTAGEVKIYGTKPDAHICVGYVPQRSRIDWRFPVSVYDVVMMGRVGQIGLFRRARQQDRLRVTEAIDAVGMTPLAQRQIGELSGGQQQRVFLARALAQEAQLILLDEPLTGLDIPSQEMILTILGDLSRRGVTLLMATHDLNQAAHFQRVLLLNHRLIADGSPHEVLTPATLAETYSSALPLGSYGRMSGTNGTSSREIPSLSNRANAHSQPAVHDEW